MVAFEPINGKPLSEAADAVSKQIQQVICEVRELKDYPEYPISSDRSQRLRELMGATNMVRDNIRVLLAAAEHRFTTFQQGAKIQLLSAGEDV